MLYPLHGLIYMVFKIPSMMIVEPHLLECTITSPSEERILYFELCFEQDMREP